MPFSFHSHSGQFCLHAKGTLEEVVLAAIDKGFLVFGLTEHVPRKRVQDLYPEEQHLQPADLLTQFEGFVKEARRLQAKYSSQIKLLIGAETEFIYPEFAEELKEIEKTYQLDYLVGSLHHVLETPIDFDTELYAVATQKAGGPSSLFEAYFDAQYELLTSVKPLVVGHFDLIRIFAPNTPVTDSIREKMMRNIDYVISYGGLFEINSRAWKKGLKYPYPGKDVLEAILAKGGRVTISDDSHGPGDVGMHYGKLYEYLRELGIKELHYLDSRDNEIVVSTLAMPLEHPFWSQFRL
ncbi:histidinol phosphate phosphatase H [Basidiobolus meristosporus CBS 931.73]|uniref:Histidinol-phosphatase n=1 Tax=Basidiobolus meristosporus CBS 931.73 TaxID=1314790 RepID=A0A1Y1YR33_9FUNG|nr:histidinol phosphate phosphatase H [Basidiobolus meristosporus CBS 931.73]|eukprot:ORY00274.1 histidinol phosphate phosphatase H [Basidiobolus meristosporus CBS 931.73]